MSDTQSESTVGWMCSGDKTLLLFHAVVLFEKHRVVHNMQNWDTQHRSDKSSELFYSSFMWARGLGAHSTWLKPWGTQSGHLTLCIHNTFTLKMHLPISAVVFIWLVVLEIYTHDNTRKTIKKKRQGHVRLERCDGNWQKVLILVTNIREIFFILLWC